MGNKAGFWLKYVSIHHYRQLLSSVLVVGVLLFFSIIQTPRNAEGQPPMATYCNVNNLISMRYPYDWNLSESASNPNLIGFIAPNPNAVVTVSTLHTGPSYITAPPPDQLAGGLLQNEKRNLNNFQLLDSRPMYIGNHDLVYEMLFTYTNPSLGQIKALQIVTDGNENPTNAYFVIQYGSTPSTFNTYLQTVMNMINTFGVALVC